MSNLENNKEDNWNKVICSITLSGNSYFGLLKHYLVNGDDLLLFLFLDDWDNLLVNMWKNYYEQGVNMEKSEVEAITTFFSEILVLIDKCIRFGILHFTDGEMVIDGACLVERISNIIVTLPIP